MILSACLSGGSASAERVGQGEVSGVTHRVLCTWQLYAQSHMHSSLVPSPPPPKERPGTHTLFAHACKYPQFLVDSKNSVYLPYISYVYEPCMFVSRK